MSTSSRQSAINVECFCPRVLVAVAEIDFAIPVEILIVDWLVIIVLWPRSNLSDIGCEEPHENMQVSEDGQPRRIPDFAQLHVHEEENSGYDVGKHDQQLANSQGFRLIKVVVQLNAL